MARGKRAKFADLDHYPNVFQYPYKVLADTPFDGKGKWSDYFANKHPIVLELGCGRGEYTISLARLFPEKNFIGVDIKGARLWTGATEALANDMSNVAFIRTNIELIEHFFDTDEVEEIWITFADPQPKHASKRLTATTFLNRYRKIMKDGGVVHLKTDSQLLYDYTRALVETNQLPLITAIPRLDTMAGSTAGNSREQLCRSITTYYEEMWRSRGRDIKYIAFRLTQGKALKETDTPMDSDGDTARGL